MRTKQLFLIVILCLLFACQEKVDLDFTQRVDFDRNDLQFHDILFLNAQDGIAVGGNTWKEGVMAVTRDGGANWKADSVSEQMLFAIDSFQDEIFATGIAGYRVKTSLDNQNRKASKLPITWHTRKDLTIDAKSGQIYVVGNIGLSVGLYDVYDLDFNLVTQDTFSFAIEKIVKTGPESIFMVGHALALYSSDNGMTWRDLRMDDDFFKAVYFTSDYGVLVGYYGNIYKSNDRGESWEKIKDLSKVFKQVYLTDVKVDAQGRIWSCGELGSLFYSDNEGEEWVELKTNTKDDFMSIAFQGDKVWVAARSGHLYEFIAP